MVISRTVKLKQKHNRGMVVVRETAVSISGFRCANLFYLELALWIYLYV